jgi:hypothetical protein
MLILCFECRLNVFIRESLFDGLVTLTHVINEASESFWQMHEGFLWQEK